MNLLKKNHRDINLNGISKKVILGLATIITFSFSNCKTPAKGNEKKLEIVTQKKDITSTNASFGVRGNCGMCKRTIETAATNIKGVITADWDKARKKITVAFDESKTNLNAIHKAIANVGYDTDRVNANEEAYNNLPGCCQYDHAMEMSLE